MDEKYIPWVAGGMLAMTIIAVYFTLQVRSARVEFDKVYKPCLNVLYPGNTWKSPPANMSDESVCCIICRQDSLSYIYIGNTCRCGTAP